MVSRGLLPLPAMISICLFDMHNPANPNFTLAKGDHTVDINESFRELRVYSQTNYCTEN
jgi:hypothetical protein